VDVKGGHTEAMKGTEVGFVKSIRNFVISLDGLPTAKIGDIVKNDAGLRGWVNALLEEKVEILLLDEGTIVPGQMFKATGQKLTVPVGTFLLGRAVSPLGVPIDGKTLNKTNSSSFELDRKAQNIGSRTFIDRQFDTGITAIDSLVPLGRGQRELVMGDSHSGKTDFLINVIVNQKKTGTICVYASIGRPTTRVRHLIDSLAAKNALSHTIIVATSSTDPTPLIFLTPYTAFSIAEYFQGQGKDILVILDDMGNHAKIYREISLLSNKPPGRESYPGDVFYQHSHLLERAGSFKKEAGGGSITALPVIELNLNDFTSFIPTNLMAMTDGHLLFRSSLFSRGQRPAVDTSLSVSRVGQQTQTRLQNLLATKIKQIIAQAAEFETVSSFSFELPFETRLVLKQREIIFELLKQPPAAFIPREIQAVLLALPLTSFANSVEAETIKNSLEALINTLSTNPELKTLREGLLKIESIEELCQKLEALLPKFTKVKT